MNFHYKEPRVLVVAGPTACGKTDLSIKLAKEYDGEIISADSCQIYRDISLGNGKVTKEEMSGIPHYMIDIVSPGEIISVSDFQSIALPILLDIISRGKTPIICGGTGQYIDALVFENSFPHVSPNFELRETLGKLDKFELFEILKNSDHRRSETIDKDNKVRLIRALEIVEAIGLVPLSEEPVLRYDTYFYIMNPSKDTLRSRTKLRLEKRLKDGMMNEGVYINSLNLNDRQITALGLEYSEMSAHLKSGSSLDKFFELTLNRINQYAKRQITWCKKYQKYNHEIVGVDGV